MVETRYPILVDTSALIALGMSEYWETAKASLRVTTTNICRTELKRHVRTNTEYAPDGSREHRLHHGSKRAVRAFTDEEAAFSVVTVVPAPSGTDAGDESLVSEVSHHLETYQYVVLNDATYRDILRRKREREDHTYRVVPPTHLLFFLYDNGKLSREEFCHGCAEMMTGEGWTSAGAVHEMWRSIPVECNEYVDDRLLPD